MLNMEHLKELVIVPTLQEMNKLWKGVYSEAAVNLLVGTAAHESTVAGDTCLKQIRGPALGIYQIEPDTHRDNWDNYLAHREDKASYMRGLIRQHMPADMDDELITNLAYATAQARLVYWRSRFDWPEDPNDVWALATIWDTWYNRNPDKGFPKDFVEHYPLEVL